MGDAEEIPQRVNPEKEPCVDGQTEQHSPTSMVDAVSKVLDDDNLLWEIIFRVGFATTLVRAALVCKRWLCHISNRKFLSRFRKLNPPRLLGMYIDGGPTPQFVPILPQPPELAAVVRRVASHNFGTHRNLEIVDCRNGNVFTRHHEGGVLVDGVYRPLFHESGLRVVPPLPTTQDPIHLRFVGLVSKEEEGGLSYLYVLVEPVGEAGNFRMHVYMLQDGVWCIHTSVTEQIHLPRPVRKAVLVGSKIYMASGDDIIVLDLTASSLSRIPLPEGVRYRLLCTTLSRSDDASGVYLTHLHVNELQLHIWLHKGDNWLLVHTICLHEMLTNLGMLDHLLEDDHVGFPSICQAGDNAEFVFFKMCGYALYLDVKSRTLRKMDGNAGNVKFYNKICSFMMIWPPTFPALKDDPARNSM